MAGLKFLLSSLRDSAVVGCERVWSEWRAEDENANGLATDAVVRQHSTIFDGLDDGFGAVIGDEMRLVEWSIGQGSNINNNNNIINETVKLHNYTVTGEFDHSVIPYDKRRIAAERRQRDRTVMYEARYQQLMQLLLSHVNCPVLRHFEYKWPEEPTGELGEVVNYMDKRYGLFSYTRGVGYFIEEKIKPEEPSAVVEADLSACAVFSGGHDGSFGELEGVGATLTEIFDDDDDMNVDDQSTRQTDDIIDDDSQTGDASIDEGSASSGGGMGKDIGDYDDKKVMGSTRKPRSKPSWTCHHCPKV